MVDELEPKDAHIDNLQTHNIQGNKKIEEEVKKREDNHGRLEKPYRSNRKQSEVLAQRSRC